MYKPDLLKESAVLTKALFLLFICFVARLGLFAFSAKISARTIDELKLLWFPVQFAFSITEPFVLFFGSVYKTLAQYSGFLLPSDLQFIYGGKVEIATVIGCFVLLWATVGYQLFTAIFVENINGLHQKWQTLPRLINRLAFLLGGLEEEWSSKLPAGSVSSTTSSQSFKGSSFHVPSLSYRQPFGKSHLNQRSFSPAVKDDAPRLNAVSPQPCIPTYQGNMKEATVVFSDIRGYTSLVEKFPAHQVIHQLNQYFSAMTEVVFKHHGRVDKYLGDGMLMYFEPTNGHISSSARNAVFAIAAMQQVLQELNKTWESQGLPTLQMGAGVNSGVIFMGNVGSQMKMDLTILGDNVNLAARLEQLNKKYGTQVIISESTQRWVKAQCKTRFIGNLQIRGKQKTCPAYELLVDKSLSDVMATVNFAKAP